MKQDKRRGREDERKREERDRERAELVLPVWVFYAVLQERVFPACSLSSLRPLFILLLLFLLRPLPLPASVPLIFSSNYAAGSRLLPAPSSRSPRLCIHQHQTPTHLSYHNTYFTILPESLAECSGPHASRMLWQPAHPWLSRADGVARSHGLRDRHGQRHVSGLTILLPVNLR